MHRHTTLCEIDYWTHAKNTTWSQMTKVQNSRTDERCCTCRFKSFAFVAYTRDSEDSLLDIWLTSGTERLKIIRRPKRWIHAWLLLIEIIVQLKTISQGTSFFSRRCFNSKYQPCKLFLQTSSSWQPSQPLSCVGGHIIKDDITIIKIQICHLTVSI